MAWERTEECRHEVLLSLLRDALTEAEYCDPLIAIHVATALHRFEQLYGVSDQSSER